MPIKRGIILFGVGLFRMECVCLAADEVAIEQLFGECAAPERTQFISIGGGDCFSIGVDESGAVIGWGSGFYGELTEPDDTSEANGTDGTSSSSFSSSAATSAKSATHTRTLVRPTQLAIPEKCFKVACGTNHVLAISQQGNLYAWGWNRHHQASPSTSEVVSKPVLIEFSEAVRVTDVAGGGMHSLALDSDCRVWSWGDNTHGQLGIGSEAETHASPALARLPSPHLQASSVAAGWAHSAILTATGELFTFGWGLYHQLGHGSTQNQNQPLAVDALSGLDASCGGPIVQVACGNWHAAARTAAGDMYTWGWGRDGQLGHGDAVTTQALPRVVVADNYFDAEDLGHRAVDLSCGSRATLVLCANGDLHKWGRGKKRSVPSRTAWGTLAQDRQICRRVAMGAAHALLLVERASDEVKNDSNSL